MAPGPIISWQIEEEKVEVVTDFIFLGSKITVDSDCSHEIKRHLVLGRKIMLVPLLQRQAYPQHRTPQKKRVWIAVYSVAVI